MVALYLSDDFANCLKVPQTPVHEAPGLLEVFRSVLQHEELCALVHGCQAHSLGVPVELLRMKHIHVCHSESLLW